MAKKTAVQKFEEKFLRESVERAKLKLDDLACDLEANAPNNDITFWHRVSEFAEQRAAESAKPPEGE